MDKSPDKNSNNGANSAEQSSNSKNGGSPSKAFASAIKAFTMTHKRLHPELYKGNPKKVGKIRG